MVPLILGNPHLGGFGTFARAVRALCCACARFGVISGRLCRALPKGPKYLYGTKYGFVVVTSLMVWVSIPYIGT